MWKGLDRGGGVVWSFAIYTPVEYFLSHSAQTRFSHEGILPGFQQQACGSCLIRQVEVNLRIFLSGKRRFASCVDYSGRPVASTEVQWRVYVSSEWHNSV